MGLGEYVEARRSYTAQVEALAERLQWARDLQTRQAAWQERARLARELHDVIGHTVNVMVIQAGAGRRTLACDRALAEKAFQTIESNGREALEELDRRGRHDRVRCGPLPEGSAGAGGGQRWAREPAAAEPSREGRGLIGIQERVALFGGDLEAGPTGGGFAVRCRFPLTANRP